MYEQPGQYWVNFRMNVKQSFINKLSIKNEVFISKYKSTILFIC
jgi:hypothetical protein